VITLKFDVLWRRLFVIPVILLLCGVLCDAADGSGSAAKPRILVIKTRDLSYFNIVTQSFLNGLKTRGYRDKTEVVTMALTGDSAHDAQMVRDQLGKHPQLLVTLGTDATRLVAAEKPAVPMLFGMILDPVSLGLVKSLDNPGGNFSGTTLLVSPGKQFDALLQAAPQVRRIGVLYTDADPTSLSLLDDARRDAERLKLEIVPVAVKPMQSTHDSLAALDGKTDALWLIPDPASTSQQPMTETLEFARQRHLPVLGASSITVRAGALLSLSANLPDLGDATSEMAVHLLDETEKPAQMRVRTPRLTVLSINLDAARALGVKIPETMLHLADEVIDGKQDAE
jgi:putative ABC transport system substrate-binding protein